MPSGVCASNSPESAGLKHRSQVRSGCRSGHRSGHRSIAFYEFTFVNLYCFSVTANFAAIAQ